MGRSKLKLLDYYNPASGRNTKWIGFRARSRDGEVKSFIWASTKIATRAEAESFCTDLLVRYRIEVKLGPAIQDPLITGGKIRKMKNYEGKEVIGFYVEANARPAFNFKF